MNSYTPTEIKHIKDMKQRVMRNVIQEVEGKSQKPKYKWKFAGIAAVFTLTALLFMFNQLFIHDPHSTIVPQIDFTHPLLNDKQGSYYLEGITLGISHSEVVERLGEKETTEIQEDGSGADLILDYKGEAIFYFYQEKLFRILLPNTNKEHFKNLFGAYKGTKFTSNGHQYLYSSKTSHLIKAELTPMGHLYVTLSVADPKQLLENEGYLKLKENSK